MPYMKHVHIMYSLIIIENTSPSYETSNNFRA